MGGEPSPRCGVFRADRHEQGESMMTTRTVALIAGILVASAGCVTINIYFPAAAAEKAADRIIDEVWQLRESRPAADDATGESK